MDGVLTAQSKGGKSNTCNMYLKYEV